MEPSRSPLRCPQCAGVFPRPAGDAVCDGCGSVYPRRFGILDLLGTPRGAIETELLGLGRENNIDVEANGLDSVKFLRVDAIETTSELMEGSRSDPTQYYQQTSAAFFEALARCRLDSGLRVIEIGADRTFWKLRCIRDFCSEAFALNIYFAVTDESIALAWPERVLGDMNSLPFADGYFDLAICSATLHHSDDPGGALQEVARVLRPGGRAIVVNEPVEGVAKSLGGASDHGRDHDIHEDPVALRTWRQAIHGAGFDVDHFVPAWFLGQLRHAERLPEGTRFRGLASVLAPVTRSSTLTDLCRALGRIPGQALLGLPLNAVLWKSEKG